MPATDDRLMRPRASLPLAAIDSLAHLSPPVDDSRTTSRTATVHHHHHSSKSENFRRLEDRMDQLHEQIMTTQRLVQALATTLATEKRRSTTRQTLRTQSSKSIQRTHTPVDTISPSVGPPSSLPVTASILLSLSPSPATTNGRTDPDVSSPEPQDAVRDLPARKASHVDHRKHSATNPLTLLAPKHGEGKQSMSLAVAHASTFIAEVTNAASAKHLATRDPAATLSRRFSLSSLDLSTPTDTRVNRVVQWSRNLFRARIESVVSPEEIQDARRAYTKLHRFSIRHNSVQRMVWDTVVMLMILVDIVVTPLALSFRFFPHGIATYNTIGNLVFASDFVVHLLSSYTTPRGLLVSGPRHTIQHYLTSPWALADFLSWFPFEVFASEQGQFLGVAKVIRLAKVSQLARRLHSAQNAGLFRFVKLLGIVFIVSHCLSCYWNWVAVDWRHAEVGYLAMTPGQQYAHCWSMVIGSLNASPPAMYTTIEEVSVAIFMLIGNVLQATVFGSVAVLIQSFGEDEVAYNKKLISTYERCRFLDIPEKLARRIQGYYENLYQETRSVDPDADAFINELSPALICEVKFQLYREMIKQIPFLSATHINPVVIEMLILHLRTVIYMQDDVLIRKGEVGDWMGFIGSKGSVGVLDPASEVRKIIRILRKGDYFGEMALLQRAKRSTTAIALTWVQIHVLCRTDLDDVKAQYPEQAEILEQEITKYMQTKVTYK